MGIEGVMVLCLPIGSLKTLSGLEPIQVSENIEIFVTPMSKRVFRKVANFGTVVLLSVYVKWRCAEGLVRFLYGKKCKAEECIKYGLV